MNYHVALHQDGHLGREDALRTAIRMLENGQITQGTLYLENLAMEAPGDASIQNVLGNAYVLQGKLDSALAAYNKANDLKPQSEEFLLNIANVLHLKGDLASARSYAHEAYNIGQGSIEASYRLAVIDIADDQPNAARQRLDDILQKSPQFAPALLQRAILKLKCGQPHEAFVDVNASLTEDPNNAFGYLIRGLLFLDNNHLDATELDLDSAVALGLKHHELEKARATLAYKKNMPEEAIRRYISLYLNNRDDIDLLFNIGIIYLESKNYLKAELYFKKVVKTNQKHHDARNGLANAFRLTGRFHEALSEYEKILSYEPINELAIYNLAGTYLELKDFPIALRYAEKAINICQKKADYHIIKARIQFEAADYDAALGSYEKVLSLDPDRADAYLYLGHIHRIKRNLDKTIEFYQKALERDPSNIYLESDLLFSRMQVCDWSTINESWPRISRLLNETDALASPFFMVALSNDPDQHKRVAERYCNGQVALNDTLDPIEPYTGHEKIRIGYFSADFNNHATMHLMAGLFEAHNREKFELYAFSFGPKIIDEMRNRAEASFDHFIDVGDFTDRATALIARHFEIDIAVDLKGYTAHSRPGIFAYRAAPVQINYLGFPGTMGADFIDYIVADPIIIPKSHEKYYSEKILRLPMSYQVNDQTRPSIERTFGRLDVGLPHDKFVFSSFNTNYKILPETLTSWARILHAVPNSVMWILADNETAKKNLINEFKARKIDVSRIIFAGRADPKSNLARQDCADLFLDAFPCTAHTTASDAVFSGVPLLTMMGETFASRVAASVLSAVGLSDLITHNRSEYEEKAIHLGNNPDECAKMSKYLKTTIRLTPLFDTRRTARDLENLYRQALQEKYKDEL